MGPDHEFWRAAICNQEEQLRSLLAMFSSQVVADVLTKKAEDRKDCKYYLDFNYGTYPPFTHHDLYGWTILHYAVLNDNANILQLLLAYGAKINSQTTQGDTALHIASARGNVQVFNVLLKCGADFLIKNKAGKTPLDVSSSMEISNTLLKSLYENVIELMFTVSNSHTLSDLCVFAIAKNIKRFISFSSLPQDLVERVFVFMRKYKQITPESLSYFRGLLRDIDIQYQSALSDDLLLEMSQHTQLLKLNISSSESAVTDKGLSYLQTLQNLQELNMGGCPGVSTQAICDLLRANPGLKNITRGRRSFVRVSYTPSDDYHPACCVCKREISTEAIFYYTESSSSLALMEFPAQQGIPCWHVHHMHECNKCHQLISDSNGVCVRRNPEGRFTDVHLKIANIAEEDSEKLIFQPSVKYYHLNHITNE